MAGRAESDVELVRPLPSPLKPGYLITIRGFIQQNSSPFSINLSCAPKYLEGDLALNAKVGFTEGAAGFMILNSYEGDQWKAEQLGKAPESLKKDKEFRCEIGIFPEYIQVSVNGVPIAVFYHRVPQERVSHVIIRGDVEIYDVSFQPQPTVSPP